MTDRLKDIPTLDREGRNLKQWGDAVLEALQTFRGTRGDKLDKALTLRDALKVGLIAISGGGSIGIGDGVGSGTGGTGGTGGPGTVAPDLTPPPTPEGLALASGFANLFIEWDAPVYTQGHGHKKTNIFGAKYAIPGALPTFTDAVRLGEAWDSRTLYAHPTELGTNWAIWITFESIDGVESVTPAGGANGVRQTIGKIGNSDLGPLIVEAENLSNGSVTGTALADKVVDATKLGDGAVTARTLVITDFQNLAGDGMGLSLDGWSVTAAFTPARVYALTPNGVRVIPTGFHAYWGGVGVNSDSCYLFGQRDSFYGPAFPVKPGEQFLCSADIVPRGGGTGNFIFRVSVAMFDAANNATLYDQGNPGAVYGAGASGYHPCSGIVTAPVGTAYGIVWVQVNADSSTDFTLNGNSYHATNLRVIRRNAGQLIVDGGITANHLAANSIAVGSAAIQDGAIRNALIGNLAVDDAKVANMSAAKLSVGDGIIGGLLRSANYSAGSAGWIVQPNGFCEFSGVTVRGTVFATAGVFTGTVYAAAGLIGAIQINADGLQNTGWVSATSGFKLKSDGTAEFNSGTTFRGTLNVKSAASGARQEITNSYIKIFDTGNVKRVQLGDLSA